MKPVLQAILVADHAYRDATTNKIIVAGIFNNITVSDDLGKPRDVIDGTGPPRKVILGGVTSGSPWAYLSLTDIINRQEFELRFVSLIDNAVLFSLKFNVEAKSPLDNAEMMLPLPELPVKQPGHYALELVWNYELLGSHRLQVKKLETPEGQP